MITEIETYFTDGCGRCDRFRTAQCVTQYWAKGLADLRALCRAAGLIEVVKWGHPCYMHAGRNLVIIGAFKNDFRLTFFNAALMQDPFGILEKQGPNTHSPDMIRFVTDYDVTEKADMITAYLLEAKAYAETGILPEKIAVDVPWPAELIEALDFDPILAESFHSLTPGRQKSWVYYLTTTNSPATRHARILKGRVKIMAGKGATER
jgi:uncharacterized protein YdeI (YjbR/CyaY-like superfamily)